MIDVQTGRHTHTDAGQYWPRVKKKKKCYFKKSFCFQTVTENVHMKFEIEIPKQTEVMLQKVCCLEKDRQTNKVNPVYTPSTLLVLTLKLGLNPWQNNFISTRQLWLWYTRLKDTRAHHTKLIRCYCKLLANSSTAVKWKLQRHWLEVFEQHHELFSQWQHKISFERYIAK